MPSTPVTTDIVTIKGAQYELQPFTAGQLRHKASQMLAAIEEISGKLQAGTISPMQAMPAMVGDCCDLVHLSLSNRYPDLTLEDIETLPFADVQAAVTEIVLISSLVGEARPLRTRSR